MTPRQIKQFGGCFLAACFLGMIGMYGAAALWRPTGGGGGPYGEGPEFGEAPPPPPKPKTRLEELDALRFTPEKALDLCREIIAHPKSPAEAEAARLKLREILEHAFSARMQRGKVDEAEPYYRELRADFADSKEAKEAHRRWLEHLANEATRAVAKKEFDRAEPLIEQVVGDPEVPPPEFFLEAYQRYLLEKWRQARAAGETDAATAYLNAAASFLIGQSGAQAVVQALGQDEDPKSLIARGDDMNAAGDPGAALTFFAAAERAADRSPGLRLPEGESAELDERINMARLNLAVQAHAAGKLTGRGSAEDFYRAVVNAKSIGQRLDAAKGMLALRMEEAQKAAEGRQFQTAEEKYRHLLGDEACEVWALQCQKDDTDPLAGVSDEDLKSVQQFHPKGNDARQTAHILMVLARKGLFTPPIPEALTAREAIPELRAGMGLGLLRSETARALQVLRAVIREHSGHPTAETVRSGIQSEIREARTTGRFEALMELTGFYVSEIGTPGSQDPFRPELFTCLKMAAEHFRQKEPMKRVFLLTLLADAFEGDPAAEPSRKEAIEKALEIAGKSPPPEASQAPLSTGPSGLDGLSYHRVFNDTGYYLLVFYDGPEKFFARLAPHRHGCVVMKDGKYTIGVAVTADDVVPYREEVTCAAQSFMSAYVIETEGQGKDEEWLRSPRIVGSFTLLRAPAGTGPFEVEPKTGDVTKSGD
ncbi:MAG: hypothetical protein HYY93_01355 [Planctomycetes bacterium]|nr:hypothetical protein [Planctomycetota bacterium]